MSHNAIFPVGELMKIVTTLGVIFIGTILGAAELEVESSRCEGDWSGLAMKLRDTVPPFAAGDTVMIEWSSIGSWAYLGK